MPPKTIFPWKTEIKEWKVSREKSLLARKNCLLIYDSELVTGQRLFDGDFVQ
jgi:hypothetical protein